MVAKYVEATAIDPASMLSNLKSFLQSYPEWNDYNFDGGTLSMVLTLLAQNTYYGALYDNMVYNEAHIDSAQLRDSIVSRAKLLGFVPRSAKSAKIYADIYVYPDNNPTTVVMERGTRFRSTYKSRDYYFVATEDTVLFRVGTSSAFKASNVELAEGFILTHRFIYRTNDDPSFTIPNRNVDTDSIKVYVQDTSSSTTREPYTLAEDLSTITGTSQVYYLEENYDGKFRVFFGDGILGKELVDGNMVVIEYRVCAGSEPNGIGTLTLIDTIGGFTDYRIDILGRALGGQELQDQEEIRFHAPRFYEMQNRIVIENDYKEHILAMHSDIEAVTAWGGEKNDPPLYGKVCISMKPFNGFQLTTQRKVDIVNSLKRLNIMSIDPVVIDPVFIYIVPDISMTYDPELTTLTAGQIHAKLATVIQNFEMDNLKRFERNFYHGQFIKTLTSADPAVVDVATQVNIHKRFSPTRNASFTYNVNFHQALDHPYEGYGSITGTTGFFMPDSSEVMYMDDDGRGTLRIFFKRADGTKTYYSNNAGTIDYAKGELRLINFAPSAYRGDEMKVAVRPKVKSVMSIRNEILVLSDVTLAMIQKSTPSNVFQALVTTDGISLTQTVTGINV